MPNYTKVFNQVYANLGSVRINFNDDTKVTHTINQIDSGDSHASNVGTYFDDGSNRVPVSIELFGNTYPISGMPSSIPYPDDTSGHVQLVMYDATYINGYELWLDTVA